MSLTHLTNEELARHADLALDPLTSTDLERELLKRFEDQLTENRVNAALLTVIDEFGMEISDTKDIEEIQAALQFAHDYNLKTVRSLLELASEHDIDTAALLQPRLELADQFDQIREDASTVIADLNKIFNPTTV